MKSFLIMVTFLFSSIGLANVTLQPERTIVIAGPITSSILSPVMETMSQLAATGKNIDIILSSPGGEVITGNLLIDYMEQLKLGGTKFRCVVRDVAASMAFQILLHCSERYATPHSYLLWHSVRLFYRGPLTAEQASSLGIQLAIADEVAIHDLRAHLAMSEKDIMWHFRNETLHQAFTLLLNAPNFFKEVTNNITNLRPKKVAFDSSSVRGFFDFRQFIYVHEQFLSTGDVQ